MSKATDKKASQVTESREKMVEDLKALITDAQGLIKETQTASGDAIAGKIDSAREALKVGINSVSEHSDFARQKAKQYSGELDDLVKKNPWKSIGIAALGGFVLSLIVRRD